MLMLHTAWRRKVLSMATTYTHIASNKQKTALLMAVYIGFIVAIVWTMQQYVGYGPEYVVVAIVLSVAMSLASYFWGDVVALSVSRAQPVTKETNPYIVNMVENLSITAGLPMPRVYVMQDPAINAFATGRDPKHASVAVTTGAIERLENEELEGVLAHELSHVGNYDIRVMTVVVILAGIISILADWFLRSHFLFGGRGRDRDRGGNPALMAIGLVLIIVAPLLSTLIKLAVSRKREYLADASGALLTRYPEGLARALEKIGRQHQPMATASDATAHLFFANPFSSKHLLNLFSTHPPLEERISRLRGMGGGSGT